MPTDGPGGNAGGRVALLLSPARLQLEEPVGPDGGGGFSPVRSVAAPARRGPRKGPASTAERFSRASRPRFEPGESPGSRAGGPFLDLRR
jgi:hypothetical protein